MYTSLCGATMWLCSCLLCPPGNDVDVWARQVKRSLQRDGLLESKGLAQVLLDESENDFGEQTELDESGPHDWIVQGVPRRPLYKEIAYRLLVWNKRVYSPPAAFSDEPKLMVDAECLGFQEIPEKCSLVSPPENHSEIRHWMRQAGSRGVSRLLGIRDTVGSAKTTAILSRSSLLEASREIHHPNSALTVAARARAKHAHRGKDSFFGVAKGSPSVHNQQAEEILVHLLENAAWINRHSFGGLDDDDFAFEIRVQEGYGARWVVHSNVNKVRFRGFLEPQMEDGHEKGWKH